MVQSFALTVPEHVTSERLKIDLDSIIQQHKGVIVFNIDFPTQWGRQDTRTYEVPATGTITTMTNERNHFEANAWQLPIGKITYSAFVSFTGFEESSPEYKNLAREVLDLQQRY